MQLSRAFCGRMDEPIQIFHILNNCFYVFGNKFFSKKKQVLDNFAFFCLIVAVFINEWPHNTFLVFDEGAIEHILGAKVWL